jgi:hypothetical protein
MQVSATRHWSGVSTGRTVGFGYSFTGLDADTDANCTCVSSGGVGAEASKGASETGASAVERRGVSGGSGSAVAAFPTEMAAGATAGAWRPIWDHARTATEAIALADCALTGSALPALKDAAPRVAPRSPIGVAVSSMPDEPKTVPHNTPNARNCCGLISQSPPRARTLKARPTGEQAIGSIVGSRPLRTVKEAAGYHYF